jgi:hypothetical protein
MCSAHFSREELQRAPLVYVLLRLLLPQARCSSAISALICQGANLARQQHGILAWCACGALTSPGCHMVPLPAPCSLLKLRRGMQMYTCCFRLLVQ